MSEESREGARYSSLVDSSVREARKRLLERTNGLQTVILPAVDPAKTRKLGELDIFGEIIELARARDEARRQALEEAVAQRDRALAKEIRITSEMTENLRIELRKADKREEELAIIVDKQEAEIEHLRGVIHLLQNQNVKLVGLLHGEEGAREEIEKQRARERLHPLTGFVRRDFLAEFLVDQISAILESDPRVMEILPTDPERVNKKNRSGWATRGFFRDLPLSLVWIQIPLFEMYRLAKGWGSRMTANLLLEKSANLLRWTSKLYRVEEIFQIEAACWGLVMVDPQSGQSIIAELARQSNKIKIPLAPIPLIFSPARVDLADCVEAMMLTVDGETRAGLKITEAAKRLSQFFFEIMDRRIRYRRMFDVAMLALTILREERTYQEMTERYQAHVSQYGRNLAAVELEKERERFRPPGTLKSIWRFMSLGLEGMYYNGQERFRDGYELIQSALFRQSRAREILRGRGVSMDDFGRFPPETWDAVQIEIQDELIRELGRYSFDEIEAAFLDPTQGVRVAAQKIGRFVHSKMNYPWEMTGGKRTLALLADFP